MSTGGCRWNSEITVTCCHLSYSVYWVPRWAVRDAVTLWVWMARRGMCKGTWFFTPGSPLWFAWVLKGTGERCRVCSFEPVPATSHSAIPFRTLSSAAFDSTTCLLPNSSSCPAAYGPVCSSIVSPSSLKESGRLQPAWCRLGRWSAEVKCPALQAVGALCRRSYAVCCEADSNARDSCGRPMIYRQFGCRCDGGVTPSNWDMRVWVSA